MKKVLFFAAAAIMMVGCSKDQVVSEMPQDNAINFGMYFGRDAQSRAAIMNTDDLKAQSFGVFAYYTDGKVYDATATPNFMFNQLVEWDATEWTYSPLKYWPNEADDKLSFFAYAPYTPDFAGNIKLANSFNNESTGAPVLEYTLASDLANHVDLLVAQPVLNKAKQNTEEKVSFIFEHALSRIGFKSVAVIDESSNDNNGDIDDGAHSKPLDGKTTITLKSIKLIGNFYKGGKLDLATGDWIAGAYVAAASTEYNWATGDFLNDDVTTTKAVVLNDDKYLTVLPHASSQQIKIEVVYTVKTTDGALKDGYSEVTNTITSDAFDFTFQKGYAYNFVLHVGLTSVKFSAEAAAWDPATGEDIVVNVPLNVLP